ncbi:hypothetical protein [Pedobacter faecalis]|uniref:hypothetical protein n=1 Tax=Pedobacter faecalis TaxID=3041495 RepID=UPI002550F734|nr:hypothetical protein [Pedobacter sp. ELA7]
MIIDAQIISQPYSGEFSEKIYDNESPWNSQSWSYIKFINDDYSEWCGQFRGFPRQVAISTINNIILVLTSDYLFQLTRDLANQTEIEDQPQYHSLASSPKGDFIIADYYHIEKISTSISNKKRIDCDIEMDMIQFKQWNNSKLEFTCDEFLNWERHLVMAYDCNTDKIEIIGEQ